MAIYKDVMGTLVRVLAADNIDNSTKQSWQKLIDAELRSGGQGAWTSHDLRKVARTAWTDLGVDGHIGEMLLNHSLGKIASTYINTQAKEQRRLALVKWHNWLDQRGFKVIHAQTGVRYEDSQNLVDALSGGACEPEPQFVKGED